MILSFEYFQYRNTPNISTVNTRYCEYAWLMSTEVYEVYEVKSQNLYRIL